MCRALRSADVDLSRVLLLKDQQQGSFAEPFHTPEHCVLIRTCSGFFRSADVELTYLWTKFPGGCTSKNHVFFFFCVCVWVHLQEKLSTFRGHD